jgi:hypothetical protein
VCALRFFYGVTVDRPEIPERIVYARTPRKLPTILSAEEVIRFLEAVSSLKSRAALTTAYAAGLRASEALSLKVTDTQRLERKVDTLTEMLGLFVRHQHTLVAHQPSFDAETARLGRARYMAFIKLVEQRLGRADSGEATALVAKEGQV